MIDYAFSAALSPVGWYKPEEYALAHLLEPELGQLGCPHCGWCAQGERGWTEARKGKHVCARVS